MSNEVIKVIFVGGLTEGKIVHDYLVKNRYVNLLASFTYKDDHRGPRHIRLDGGETIIRESSLLNYIDYIRELQPDLIFVSGWSELIPDELLKIPRMGIIGFHPSKLPFNRGRSVLAWQIEENYSETALTMFKYSNYPDGGDIIAQETITIEDNDYINDVLDKVDKATKNLITAYFPLIRKGLVIPRKQDLSIGQFRRLRNDADSEIDWNQNSLAIYNKIRAISHPYPGATTTINGIRCKVWRSLVIKENIKGDLVSPGVVVAKYYDDTLLVKTRDSYLLITEYEKE